MLRVAAAVMVAAVVALPARAQQPELAPLLGRVAAYVQRFVDDFTNVVAEETYLQQFRQAAGRRELKSDFLLVKYPGEEKLLLTFRDVLVVNSRPVRDQQDRVTKLFLEPFTSAVRRAAEIQREGERHSLDRGRLADPLGAMAFLQSAYHENFRFGLGARATRLGADVVTLEAEQKLPPESQQAPLRLRAWVSERTGRVVRTQVLNGLGATVRFTTTDFGRDEALGIDVPLEMRDELPIRGGDEFVGTARYGKFRRFTVRAEQSVDLPPDPR